MTFETLPLGQAGVRLGCSGQGSPLEGWQSGASQPNAANFPVLNFDLIVNDIRFHRLSTLQFPDAPSENSREPPNGACYFDGPAAMARGGEETCMERDDDDKMRTVVRISISEWPVLASAPSEQAFVVSDVRI